MLMAEMLFGESNTILKMSHSLLKNSQIAGNVALQVCARKYSLLVAPNNPVAVGGCGAGCPNKEVVAAAVVAGVAKEKGAAAAVALGAAAPNKPVVAVEPKSEGAAAGAPKREDEVVEPDDQIGNLYVSWRRSASSLMQKNLAQHSLVILTSF